MIEELSQHENTPPQARLLFATKAKAVADSTTQLINQSRQAIDQIIATASPASTTFENVLLPLAHVRNALAAEAGVLGFYKEVSSDESLRNASVKSKLLLENFNNEIAMREDLFVLIDAVVKINEILDDESARLLRREHRAFQDNGLGLPATDRVRFAEVKTRINEATSEFRRNVNEENEHVDFTEQDLVGVPAHVLEDTMLEDGPQNEKVFRLTFQPNHFYPTMRYAQSSETRKRYMIAYENRCADNVPLFRDIVLLRDEAARMLGYNSHAQWRAENLMAGTPEVILTFLDDLRSRLQPGLQNDLDALKKLKSHHLAAEGFDFDGRFYVWDISFYHRLMLETQHQVDQKRIAEYFPIQTVVPAMLNNFQRLFGLQFHESSDDNKKLRNLNQIWHDDVQVFDVWDSNDLDGSFLGFLYLDLYARESKYGNAANFNLQPVCILQAHESETSLTTIGIYQTRRVTPLPQHSSALQLFKTHLTKTKSTQPQRRNLAFPRIGSWYT